MRIAAAVLLAGLAMPAMSDEPPVFRQGLWEFNRSVEGGDGKPVSLVTRKCTSPTEDMRRKNQAMANAGCKSSALVRNGNVYRSSADCTIQNVAIHSTSVITAQGDTAYRADIDTRQGSHATREILIAHRLGDC